LLDAKKENSTAEKKALRKSASTIISNEFIVKSYDFFL